MVAGPVATTTRTERGFPRIPKQEVLYSAGGLTSDQPELLWRGEYKLVSDHAGWFPVAGQHDFRGGRAARRQFGREKQSWEARTVRERPSLPALTHAAPLF